MGSANGIVAPSPGAVDMYDDADVEYVALKAMINSTTGSSAKIVIDQFRKIVSDPKLKPMIRQGIMPYLYSAAFLSFCGREITKVNLEKTLGSIGLKMDDRLADIAVGSGVTNHLSYVYAFYFLLASGVDLTADNIAKVVSSLGLRPDKDRIDFVLNFEMIPSTKQQK